MIRVLHHPYTIHDTLFPLDLSRPPIRKSVYLCLSADPKLRDLKRVGS